MIFYINNTTWLMSSHSSFLSQTLSEISIWREAMISNAWNFCNSCNFLDYIQSYIKKKGFHKVYGLNGYLHLNFKIILRNTSSLSSIYWNLRHVIISHSNSITNHFVHVTKETRIRKITLGVILYVTNIEWD